MKTVNLKNALKIVLAISVLCFVVKWLLSDRSISFTYILNSFNLSVTINTFISLVFIKWGWKFKVFRGWLVLVPNLNGLWKGSLRSSWIDPVKLEPYYTDDVCLNIRQTLFSISCVMTTAQMSSYSITANILIDNENQRKQLIYSYQSEPKQDLQGHSRIHYGTTKLDLNDVVNPTELSGSYWTNRETSGVLLLEKQ